MERLFTKKPPICSRVDITVVALGLVATLLAVWVVASHRGSWPGYSEMVTALPHPAAWLRWVVGDISEVAFYKHELASLGLLSGAYLAWWASKRGKAWQGFSICYGTGLWPWVVTSSLIGLLLSNLLWGWSVTAETWQPTFAAFVSLPAAIVLMFGSGWKVALNGAVLGALLVTPLCLLIVNLVCVPLGLPAVVGNVLGMAIGSVIAFALCRRVPSLVRSDAIAPDRPIPVTPPSYGVFWSLRRVLADFSEAPFFGNELASLGLLAGVLLAYALNPMSPAYGSGLLLHMVGAQALTSAFGVVIWRHQWIKRGWYPTYVPLVSVVPAAVLTHGGSWMVVTSSALLGALVAPPLACAIAARLPAHFHPYIGNVVSMALSTLMIVPIIGWLAT
ncbi:hypothetical protein FBY10_107103 [Pseudomonas sp. SJZ103]|uniref:hypothetical protein n=1 Tax=unclassified Pseudomonas TaxID=196821 RepID=UPI0011AD78AD|nr:MULTISPECIES: hypothetical protein [unclassified Pseudomonas]TWC67944.1 hypothetical protein FBY10_107103 [Pseudomonas sp. SJZ103]TWC84878.1 hypothetical protein FBY08_107103 [Pseudomonas sp. SJZ094]